MSEQQKTSPPQKEALPWWVRIGRVCWRSVRWIWVTFILSLVIGTLSNLSTTITNNRTRPLDVLSKLFVVQLVRTYPLPVCAIFGLFGLLTLGSWLISRQQASVDLGKQDQSNRMKFLRRMYYDWIDVYLKGTLEPKDPIVLGLIDRPDLLPSNKLHKERPGIKPSPSSLPPGTTIEQVYEKTIQGQLLIIGKQGSGKTTLFLHLAQHLIDRAEQDKTQPIPAIFNISSWAQKRRPFADWLVEELVTQYRFSVSESDARELVRGGHLLLMLDGLDELKGTYLSACIEEINAYLKAKLNEGQAAPLVICCRSDDYRDPVPRLQVQRVIEVDEASDEQIETYFRSNGTNFELLWNTVRSDTQLHELARRPLMLTVLTKVYQGSDQSQVPTGKTDEETWRIIWNAYINKMLQNDWDKKNLQWEEQQVRVWLTRLAKKMQAQNQPGFRVEGLQQDWLPDRLRRLFPCFVGVLGGIIVGIIVGAVFGVLIAVLCSIFFGVLAGVIVNNREITPAERLKWDWKKFGHFLPAGIVCGTICGILGSVLFRGSLSSILGGVLGGMAFAAINGVTKAREEISPEKLGPNAGIRQSLRSGLVVGVYSGVVVAFIVAMLGGVLFGTFSGMVFGVLSGIEKIGRSDGGIGRPSAGIPGGIFILLIGLVFGIGGAFVGWLFFGVFTSRGILGAVFDGVVFGIYFSILDGGDAFFIHYFLRIFLWLTNLLPLRLVTFLDAMVERVLFSRVGGSYRFYHSLLQEHFANGYASPVENNERAES